MFSRVVDHERGREKMKFAAVFCLMGLAYTSVLAGPVFVGEDGLVIIEVESTGSSRGDWEKNKSIAGYTGDGHFEFTGNKPATGPAKDPLKYQFMVDQDGVYRLLIRCHKRLAGEEPDKCNDCYVRLDGDFTTGGDASQEILESDTKLFGGSPEGWGWSNKLDVGHKKYQPLYTLKAGEKYTLVVSGRSQRFNMDRIVWKHESVSDADAKDPKRPESKSK
jgi:hypothetical protein